MKPYFSFDIVSSDSSTSEEPESQTLSERHKSEIVKALDEENERLHQENIELQKEVKSLKAELRRVSDNANYFANEIKDRVEQVVKALTGKLKNSTRDRSK